MRRPLPWVALVVLVGSIVLAVVAAPRPVACPSVGGTAACRQHGLPGLLLALIVFAAFMVSVAILIIDGLRERSR
jgi:hypothetical protein